MLLFHQDDFRTALRQLLNTEGRQPAPTSLGFLSTVVAVCAIGLQYLGPHRKELLATFNIDPHALKEKMFELLERRLLEILSLGSLEAVQTCVLLGTYYLYHGEPGLAWPICGCGLRIAQAISLHRRIQLTSAPDMGESSQRANEARKRCWWAIYEVETFCSMLYGLPPSISDNDCDVEFLEPYAKNPAREAPRTVDSSVTSGATLLSYKPMMSKLSKIVKSTLTDLYRIRPDSPDRKTPSSNRVAYIRDTVQKVRELDGRLRTWHEQVPSALRLHDSGRSNSNIYSDEELEYDIGASGQRFETLIFRLQALALELAYQNARILIHRPLLTCRMIVPSLSSQTEGEASQTYDPCQISVQTCRDAALQTSQLGSLPIFRQACHTYAVALVGMHLFTAGITLCIMASLEPLSRESHESKLGLHRLMHMQTYVKSRSTMADQGLQILKKLIALIMEKELTTILESPRVMSGSATEPESGQAMEQVRPAVTETAVSSTRPAMEQEELVFEDDVRSLSEAHKDGRVLSNTDVDLVGHEFYEDHNINCSGLLSFPSVNSISLRTPASWSKNRVGYGVLISYRMLCRYALMHSRS